MLIKMATSYQMPSKRKPELLNIMLGIEQKKLQILAYMTK